MDRVEKRILVKVGIKQSENLCHRKGKGSLTTNFGQGLVDPNSLRNCLRGKGSRLIFLHCLDMRGNTSTISDVSG